MKLKHLVFDTNIIIYHYRTVKWHVYLANFSSIVILKELKIYNVFRLAPHSEVFKRLIIVARIRYKYNYIYLTAVI